MWNFNGIKREVGCRGCSKIEGGGDNGLEVLVRSKSCLNWGAGGSDL